MEPRVLTNSDKNITGNIYFIPVKKDGTPLLDTSKVTDMQWMFGGCTKLTTIPLLDTSKVTDMSYMFDGCTNLTTIPLLDTSNATNMHAMFANCSSLTTIPLLNTSKDIDMSQMFYNCTNLTTIPLLNTSKVTDNILAMCANAVKITSNKTLKYIGLTEEQATICQGLSNYSAFTTAGWTTGY